MRTGRTITKALIGLFLVESALSQVVGDPENPEHRNAPKGYMKTSGVILDICVYEREFIPSEGEDGKNPPWTSGKLIERAVVTGVHKGNTKVGTKIEIVGIVIDPPQFLGKFRSVVEGELRTYFYFGEELPEPKDGRHVVDHNQMDFERDKDKDVVAFLEELHAKSAQNKKSEQAGADQPATAPELKSERKDKAKPEAEVRPQ